MSTPINIPKKLTIFYAYPSTVNNTYSVPGAVDVFNDYDLVVFGEGIEFNSHPDHANTQNIIQNPQMANTEVYGYVNSTRTFNDFKDRVNKWKNMGVKGIFCDSFGYDFGITRIAQNNMVNHIHSKNLKAFVNAWNPDDVFSSTIVIPNNLLGTAPVINSNDWYLAQSYQIVGGSYQDVTFWKTRSDKMTTYRQSFGTKMACITTYDTSDFDQNKADYSYYSAVIYNFDAWGWGEYNFSATSVQLPWRQRKDVLGTKFKNSMTINTDIYERQTNVGIKINTTTHAVDVILS
jgi:hypothetical protein